jgi:hypothetical protein
MNKTMPTSHQYPQEEEIDLLSSSSQTVDDSVELQETKSKLLELKQKMEEYERRERELENLRIRRQEILIGQKQMRERFMRALTVLERADYDARREVEQIQIARQTFSEHLQEMEEINPHEWLAEDMDNCLNKASSQIEQARTVYNQLRARISTLNGQDIEEPSETGDGIEKEYYVEGDSFSVMLRKGFAFSLPLLIVLFILIVVLLIRG